MRGSARSGCCTNRNRDAAEGDVVAVRAEAQAAALAADFAMAETLGNATLRVSDFMEIDDDMVVNAAWLPMMSSLTPIPNDKKFGMYWRIVKTNHTDIKLGIMAEIMNNALGDPARYGSENNTMMQLAKLDNDLMHFLFYKQVSGNIFLKVVPLLLPSSNV